jgi:hypothetical protein
LKRKRERKLEEEGGRREREGKNFNLSINCKTIHHTGEEGGGKETGQEA